MANFEKQWLLAARGKGLDSLIATLTPSQRESLTGWTYQHKAGDQRQGMGKGRFDSDTIQISVSSGPTGIGLRKRHLVESVSHSGHYQSGLAKDWYLTELGEKVRERLLSGRSDDG
tara:strand:+ start:807 stop:1154 length:348 start_codon:yes stop_codon:yes gene_type:complete